ncbi:MAG: hypothetical protein HUK07_09180 [Bacteroidaceae bacterium]|nr:hypothetical protein [Bacteroidaceae bacterium]
MKRISIILAALAFICIGALAYNASTTANVEAYLYDNDGDYTNVRYARNLFENTITAQADRFGATGQKEFDTEQLSLIEKSDIAKANEMTKN